MLEALREQGGAAGLVFTSTNKVYGALDDIPLTAADGRYSPNGDLARTGVDERRPLYFHTPYGCSKGAADQYVLDYARSFGLPAFVFRMSCIYGPRQHGHRGPGLGRAFPDPRRCRTNRSRSTATAGRCATCCYVDDLWTR